MHVFVCYYIYRRTFLYVNVHAYVCICLFTLKWTRILLYFCTYALNRYSVLRIMASKQFRSPNLIIWIYNAPFLKFDIAESTNDPPYPPPHNATSPLQFIHFHYLFPFRWSKEVCLVWLSTDNWRWRKTLCVCDTATPSHRWLSLNSNLVSSVLA